MYRKFVSHPVEGYEAIQAKPFENRFLLEQVPDFYERLRGSYDENFYRQEVLGDYLNVRGGLVYHAFDRERNVRRMKVDPARPVVWALDFNVDPMCSVVAQVERNGEVSVLDEIVLRRATTEQACEEFEKRFGLPLAGVVVYGDASGASMHTTGYSDYQVIRNYFRSRMAKVAYRVPKANPPVRDRVSLVNARLCNARGEAQLFVDPKCKELIDDFEQVSYQEESTQIDKDKDRRRTHMSDALGYLIWQEGQQRDDRGTRGEAILTTNSHIEQEHPDYTAKARMWRRYRDLYAGGEQFRGTRGGVSSAAAKGAARGLQERLARVFYENYLGSIVDWYTATLVRREPILEFEGTNERAKDFFAAVRAELRSARDDADAVLQATDYRSAGLREVVCGGGFPARG